jgi:hypothetical protein
MCAPSSALVSHIKRKRLRRPPSSGLDWISTEEEEQSEVMLPGERLDGRGEGRTESGVGERTDLGL